MGPVQVRLARALRFPDKPLVTVPPQAQVMLGILEAVLAGKAVTRAWAEVAAC